MPSSRPPAATGFALLVAMIALFAGAKAVVYSTIDPDCFWHLRVGEQLFREGVHPIVDNLSFASIREPWVPYSWLAEVGMAKLWSAGGFRAAVAAAAIMQAMFVVFIALGCREVVASRNGRDTHSVDQRFFASVLAVAFATLLSLSYMSFRPVTLALMLLALIGWLLLRDRRMGELSKAIWLIVPMTVLLTNVHFFVFIVPMWIGCLMIGAIWERWKSQASSPSPGTPGKGRDEGSALAAIGNQFISLAQNPHPNPLPEYRARGQNMRRYVILLLLTLLATTATPLLPGVIKSVVHYSVADPMIRGTFIGEMQPFYSGSMGKVSLAMVLIFAACVWMKQEQIRAGERIWLLAGSLMLLQMGRLAPVFSIIAAPLFAITMPALSDRLLGRRSIHLAVTAVLLLGLGRLITDFSSRSSNLATWMERLGPDAPGYPTTAADYVATSVSPKSGRLLNEFSWGGYLEWRLGDHYQVLLDGRTQLFTPQFWKTIYLTGEAPRTQYLSTIDADAAIIPVKDSILRASLIALGWKSVHTDARAEVLVPARR